MKQSEQLGELTILHGIRQAEVPNLFTISDRLLTTKFQRITKNLNCTDRNPTGITVIYATHFHILTTLWNKPAVTILQNVTRLKFGHGVTHNLLKCLHYFPPF